MKKSKNLGKENVGSGINPMFVLTVDILYLTEMLNGLLAKFNISSKNLSKEKTTFSKTIVTVSKGSVIPSHRSVKRYKMLVSGSNPPDNCYRTCITITLHSISYSKISALCYKTSTTYSTYNITCDKASANSYRLALEIIKVLEQLEIKSASLNALSDSI